MHDMTRAHVRHDSFLCVTNPVQLAPPPAPMNHVKKIKGWPPRDAPLKLVQQWRTSFPPDQRGLVKMKNPARLSNKTSNA